MNIRIGILRILLRRARCVAAAVVLAFCTGRASAFDPQNGDWQKSDPNHIRIMTFNIEDGLGVGQPTTPATATTIGSQYAYIGLICQALQPDVICLQEVEPVNPPATAPNTATYVQMWADEYFGSGVMHVYVSTATDGYNRNVTVSRFPYTDLDGDGDTNDADIFVFPGGGPGGTPPPPGTPTGGHIRGWAQSEIDLPDATYPGDLFVGNAHLRSGGLASDAQERLVAAQNTAYWINEALNASNAPFHPPMALSATTPVVLCGDMNQDSLTTGPVPWLRGWTSAANDGTDRDGSEMEVAAAADPFTGSDNTHDSGSRYDYIIVQDSIATVVDAFVFNSLSAAQNGVLPAELAAVQSGFNASLFASDHRAVVVDLAMPMFSPADLDRDGDVDVADQAVLANCLAGPNAAIPGGCSDTDIDGNGFTDLRDFAIFQRLFVP
ncbi:MAG: endonuclease/exonuclease/phosphatase family protein [Phycisphaerales bacterium]|nr:endonuclease/exonuclease/phosphatase family protein [Phycisphaerales bacterium]